VPGVAQLADLVTNDGGVARGERGERGAFVLGGASTPGACDEAIELVVTPGAAAEGELPCLDDVEQPVHERVELSVGKAGAQIAAQLEAGLLELADALFLGSIAGRVGLPPWTVCRGREAALVWSSYQFAAGAAGGAPGALAPGEPRSTASAAVE
jgi:hypothetical protein